MSLNLQISSLKNCLNPNCDIKDVNKKLVNFQNEIAPSQFFSLEIPDLLSYFQEIYVFSPIFILCFIFHSSPDFVVFHFLFLLL